MRECAYSTTNVAAIISMMRRLVPPAWLCIAGSLAIGWELAGGFRGFRCCSGFHGGCLSSRH